MAANKTAPGSKPVDDFIATVPDPGRREDAGTLIRLMRKVTAKKPLMWGPSIVGFGNYHYRYESGREGDMPVVALSPRKPATVIYGLDVNSDLLARLGPYTSGKGCLYLKRLADVDIKVLEALIRDAVAARRSGAKKP